MEQERVEATAADLRGPVEHDDGRTDPGTTVELKGRRFRVVSLLPKSTGFLDIAFKEVGGAREVSHHDDVLPHSKYIVLRDRSAGGT